LFVSQLVLFLLSYLTVVAVSILLVVLLVIPTFIHSLEPQSTILLFIYTQEDEI